MDRPDSNIIIIDENEAIQRAILVSKIIAAALLERVRLCQTAPDNIDTRDVS